MDQIAASHITWPDFIIYGVAIILFAKLLTLPPNSTMCRVVAILSACAVVAVWFVLLFADNLGADAVVELALVASWLCIGLWKWNDARTKSNIAFDLP